MSRDCTTLTFISNPKENDVLTIGSQEFVYVNRPAVPSKNEITILKMIQEDC